MGVLPNFKLFDRFLRYQGYLLRQYFGIFWKGFGRGQPKVFGNLRTCKYMSQYLEIQLRLEIQYSLVGDSLCTYYNFGARDLVKNSSRPHTTFSNPKV